MAKKDFHRSKRAKPANQGNSLFFVFFALITLAVGLSAILTLNTSNLRGSAASSSAQCIDSDAMDYNTKGYVTFDGMTYWDSCSGSKLSETYCYLGSNGQQSVNVFVYDCPAGYTCQDGACVSASGCGNNVLEAGEECDGAELGGQSCRQLGFSYGELSCSSNCVLDTSNCVRTGCGNGVVDPREQCDDGNKVSGDGCDQYCMLEKK
jgi:cysteine-rich repeat protein